MWALHLSQRARAAVLASLSAEKWVSGVLGPPTYPSSHMCVGTHESARVPRPGRRFACRRTGIIRQCVRGEIVLYKSYLLEAGQWRISAHHLRGNPKAFSLAVWSEVPSLIPCLRPLQVRAGISEGRLWSWSRLAMEHGQRNGLLLVLTDLKMLSNQSPEPGCWPSSGSVVRRCSLVYKDVMVESPTCRWGSLWPWIRQGSIKGTH